MQGLTYNWPNLQTTCFAQDKNEATYAASKACAACLGTIYVTYLQTGAAWVLCNHT